MLIYQMRKLRLRGGGNVPSVTSHRTMEGLELRYSKARRSPWLTLTEHPVEA